MDLKNNSLLDWFRRRERKDFAGLKTDYVTRYGELENFLESDVHPLVSVGAAVQDRIFLTDHGPNHIATVIKRASELVASPKCKLSAYEVYILLAAIQLHDIGNILGRKEHEARPKNLRGRLDAILGDDSIEKRHIRSIAEAHGGARNGDKDTIRYVPDDPVLNQIVRTRFLAALLRFADELADDSQRISHFALSNEAIPTASLLHYKYSASLQSVIVDLKGQTVRLHFELTKEDVKLEFERDRERVYLIDEILNRTLKMHKEKIYCMRFLMPDVQIEAIEVKVNVFLSSISDEKLLTIGYRLEDRGYPSHPPGGIYDLCPDLKEWRNGMPLNGVHLRNELSDGIR